MNNLSSKKTALLPLALLFFIIGCDLDGANNSQKPAELKPTTRPSFTTIGKFDFLNLTDPKFKIIMENAINHDKKSELICGEADSSNSKCIAIAIDLNRDNQPEVLFESIGRIGDGNSTGIAVYSKVGRNWQRFPISTFGYQGFGGFDSNSKTAFNLGQVTSVSPKWKDLKIGPDVYIANYGGEPLTPISKFSLLERMFGVFPAGYHFRWVKDKYRPNSFRLLLSNMALPNDIFLQDFEKEEGGDLPCNNSTNGPCLVLPLNFNGGTVDFLVEEFPGHYFAFSKEETKWGTVSFAKPIYDINFDQPKSILVETPRAIEPKWNDIKIGQYIYRVSPKACGDEPNTPNCG